jgi:hypothetical protein
MEGDIVLSFELLVLVNWLMQNEKPMLSNLVKHALKNGLAQELEKISNTDDIEVNEQFYTTIISFLLFMEDSLIDCLSHVNINEETQDDMLPVLKKIDMQNINIKPTFSVAKKSKTQNISTEETKDVLLQQILKSWKPNKNDLLN